MEACFAYLRQLNMVSMALRIILAMLMGGLVGFERERKRRPAGFRTYMLVALGAALTMILSQYLDLMLKTQWLAIADGSKTDVSRFGAQVINGVGFLGAGTIMKEGPSIKGLTTAASVWAVACLGVAAGGGYYAIALIGTVCIMVTLVIFEWLQRKLMTDRYDSHLFSVTCSHVGETLNRINELSLRLNVRIAGIQIEEDSPEKFEIQFTAGFSGRHAEAHLQDFMAALSEDDNTTIVQSHRSRV